MSDPDYTGDAADDAATVIPLPPLTDPASIAPDRGDAGPAK